MKKVGGKKKTKNPQNAGAKEAKNRSPNFQQESSENEESDHERKTDKAKLHER